MYGCVGHSHETHPSAAHSIRVVGNGCSSVVDLAYTYQLPMALECADRDATTRPLNLQFHNESVRRILEGIIRQSPAFRVSFAEGW